MDLKHITVIIIAGGKGTRLFPQTLNTPKPMLKVGGKPVLEHILNMFHFYGFRKFIFSVGYKQELITNYFGNGKKFGVEIQYVKEQEDNLLGNAAGIALAKNKIKGTFIVTFGDVLRDLDIPGMVKFHHKTKALGTINLYKKPKDNATSLVKIDHKLNILEFVERPDITLIKNNFVLESSSFFIFEPEVLSFFKRGEFQDLGRDVIPKILQAGKKVKSYTTKDYLIDVGTPQRLTQARLDSEKGKFKL